MITNIWCSQSDNYISAACNDNNVWSSQSDNYQRSVQ